MQYLRILNALRTITGQRSAHHFPNQYSDLEIFDSPGSESRVLFIYNTSLGRQVLDSREFGQYDFTQRALALAGEERTNWIRRFCFESPVMLDGTAHQVRRRELSNVLKRCTDALNTVKIADLASDLLVAARHKSATSLRVSQEIVTQLLSICLGAITGRDANLPTEELMAVDFFNPFPKPSSLYRCDHAISACMHALQWQSLNEAERTAVSVMIVMGVSPLVATATASLNALLEVLAIPGSTHDEAVTASRKVDFHATVPTNFVMRRCLTTTVVNGHELREGDLAYVFLGPVSGCPFSALTTLPFGSGRHVCSGRQLSLIMLASVHDALELAVSSLAELPLVNRRTPVEAGRASAFLRYADETAPQTFPTLM